MRHFLICLLIMVCAGAATLPAQVAAGPLPTPPPVGQQAEPPQQPAPAPPPPLEATPAQPAPAQAAPAQGGPPPAATAPSTRPQSAPLSDNAPLELTNASLTDMIHLLAQRLKLNYILDRSVSGTVSVYLYGEARSVDLMALLQTILRINGFSMVEVDGVWRIVPAKMVNQLPLDPIVNAQKEQLPESERMVLNLIFLKYATATEIQKLITPFLGEGAAMSVYEPANLLILQDNSRNMRRTMELIGMFDSDSFAGQRVKLFDVEHSRPSDLVKDLDAVFRAYALSEKSSSVRFLPVDRINTLIAVAPNPGIFVEVKNWIDKLDIPVKVSAGATTLHQYRLKYGRAETVAMAIMAVLTGNPWAMVNMAAMSGGMGMGGYGGMGMGGYGGAGGMGMSGLGGYGGGGYGGYGGGYGGGGYAGGMGYGGMGMGGNGVFQTQAQPMYTGAGGVSQPPVSTPMGASANPVPVGAANDLTGSYLGLANASAGNQQGPTVIPNPFDNTLLVRSTPQEWEQIQGLLRQIDIAPRQVLIDAKIYEVDLTGAFSSGVSAYLERRGLADRRLSASSSPVTSAGGGGLNLSVGALVLRSHEVITALSAAETTSNTRLISSPSIIATDSIPAVMNVGQDVPVLTSQAIVGGVQSGGTNLFSNTVSNRSTGVTLNVVARVNSSGVVTMMLQQDVSAPVAPSTGGIQSPSFSRRSFTTQVTVQDGDTIAIGGFIQEQSGTSSSGIPFLHRIPVAGALFGSKSVSKGRTELIVLLTPRVIYDATQVADATEEMKTNLKRVQKLMRDDEE